MEIECWRCSEKIKKRKEESYEEFLIRIKKERWKQDGHGHLICPACVHRQVQRARRNF